jgi:AcrR family transcriptional regulator
MVPSIRHPALENPRVQRTRSRILTTARELLAEAGPAGLTYSRLAERAGVTRQTLYRHWPARSGLLVDLILEGPEVGYPQPGSDPRAVATAWLVSLRAGLTDPAARAAVLAVTAEADHDPDCARALEGIAADRLAALNDLLAPSGYRLTAADYMLLTGPLLARLFFERGEVTSGFLDVVVSQWLCHYDHCGRSGSDGGGPGGP